jgi:hypothetical protein
MNDATLKQIAAVKATVTRGSHIWTSILAILLRCPLLKVDKVATGVFYY